MTPTGLVVFDWDGTLLDGRTIVALGSAFGFQKQVDAFVAARRSGTADVQATTVGIARLLKGVPTTAFDAAVATTPLAPGAGEAIAAVARAGFTVAVCSETYTRAILPRVAPLGVNLVAANMLEERDGVLTGELRPWGPTLGLGPSAAAVDKREALPMLARAAGVPLDHTVLVGDGDADALAMPLVGLGVSYRGTELARSLARHRIEDLRKVPRIVDGWFKR